MTFTNPAVINVTTQTVKVLASEQDYFYWPCIPGEKYTPTFTANSGASVGYDVQGVYPCVSCTDTTSSNSTAQWPTLPPYKYSGNAFTGYTVSFRINIAGSNSTNGGIFYCAGAAAQFGLKLQPGVALQYIDNVGTVTNINAVTISAAAWYSCALTFDAAGVCSVVVNGVTVATGLASSASITQIKPQLVSTRTSAGQASIHITQLQVTYT